MKILQRDLIRINSNRVYQNYCEEIKIENNPYIYRIEDIDFKFNFYYEYEKLKCAYEIYADMICPDAWTLEEVRVPLNLYEEEDVTFDMDKEGIYIEDGIEASELAKMLILLEVPLSVKKENYN